MDDKKKALASAMAAIEKQYGKGSVMILGENKVQKMDVFSTGCLSLDKAIGVGGYPKGRIIEIYGPESAGKCLTPDNYVLTDSGYKTVKKIFNSVGLELSDEEKTVEMIYPLVNMNGDVENTTHFTYNGKRKTHVITTLEGTRINCTGNHPLRVLTEDGYPVWKKAEDIQKGDVLIGMIGQNRFGSNHVNEAYSLGVLAANGHFGKDYISLNVYNPEVCGIFEKQSKELFGEVLPGKADGNAVEYEMDASASSFFYKKFNWDWKTVPDVIFNGNRETQASFVRGYLDASAVYEGDALEVSSERYDLIKGIRLLLSNMGIYSHLMSKEIETAESVKPFSVWTLYITGIDIKSYLDIVGTNAFKDLKGVSGSREIYYVSHIVDAYRRNMGDYETPKSRTVNVDTVKELLRNDSENPMRELLSCFANENLIYELVLTNAEGETVPTFDFAMEKTHSFICEGIINHNTTVTLHAIASCQKAGGTAAFIDAEHALDPQYAMKLGVDINSLIISQPDNGEQALDIADVLIRSGAIDMIVIDSVAALVPKAELEGEMGDSFVGLQARMMSKAMRKLAGAINKSNCVAIFINQIREKIGVMYGPNETTGGGRALKFFSSVRIEVRRMEDIKNGTEKVGVRTKAKIVKNKVAPPFKEAVFEIHFGEGISQSADILTIAIDNGIVEKSGAWFTYKEQRFQGKENLRKAIDADEKLRTSLISDINAMRDEAPPCNAPDEDSSVFDEEYED